MSLQRWSAVCDAGPTLNRHRGNVSRVSLRNCRVQMRGEKMRCGNHFVKNAGSANDARKETSFFRVTELPAAGSRNAGLMSGGRLPTSTRHQISIGSVSHVCGEGTRRDNRYPDEIVRDLAESRRSGSLQENWRQNPRLEGDLTRLIASRLLSVINLARWHGLSFYSAINSH